ncbi:MAG TPA: tyrosine-type recombinase/integrase [Candidatus Methylacidiphilales bacterium]|jgi:integrase|nr:tyrosine-type recombinase/integrase [Candidatus Methylacidiphilales bacterium]
MENRYRLFRRGNGVYYALEASNLRQMSLRTRSHAEATRLIAAKNQASDVPQLNRAMAKVYASAASPELMERTWQEVMDAYARKSVVTTRRRVERAFRSEPFRVLSRLKINETDAAAFWAVLNHKKAGNAANHFLRRLQNFAWGMRWLFEPVIPNPLWPKVKKKKTTALSIEEHARIIASEQNLEHRLYYEMLWETGGSQSDIANLHWNRVDLRGKVISFYRDKLNEREEEGQICGLSVLVIGPRIRAILNQCPQTGYLFPVLQQWKSEHRTTEFARRCRIAGVKDRQLKGYRYAWAQRAQVAGMPQREAMNHLGHKSKAIHAAYAGDAKTVTLPLEHYEAEMQRKIVEFRGTEATGT